MEEPSTPAPGPALPPEIYGGGKRKGRVRKRHTVAKVLLSTLVVLALVTGLGVTFLYRHLNGNYTKDSVEDQLTDRPPVVKIDAPKQPLNILVMGSDTREGAGNGIDGTSKKAGLSDTTILMHISADRKSAYGISIPRDTLVDRPDCLTEDHQTIPGAEVAQWNTAFALGGPACTIQQFEHLTDIRVTNYMVVDFRGFKSMVDAVGGVEVCIPEDIDDSAHGITLAAGTRKIYGDEALAYVRLRHTGDGTDLGRIQRQQAFISSMIARVASGDILSRPDRLIRFLDAATKSLTTDIDSLKAMADIGRDFSGVGLDKIQFVTAPWEYSTRQEGRVELLPSAEALWEKVRNDNPLGSFRSTAINAGEVPGAKPSSGSTPGTTPSSGSTAKPGKGGQQTQTQASADQLAAAGLCT